MPPPPSAKGPSWGGTLKKKQYIHTYINKYILKCFANPGPSPQRDVMFKIFVEKHHADFAKVQKMHWVKQNTHHKQICTKQGCESEGSDCLTPLGEAWAFKAVKVCVVLCSRGPVTCILHSRTSASAPASACWSEAPRPRHQGCPARPKTNLVFPVYPTRGRS